MSSYVLPFVYACSGCLSVAQAANRLAVDLDRAGRVEISCISGVDGSAHTLVKTARNGQPILALGGCVLVRARTCLATVGVVPDVRFVLNQCGAEKRYYTDCNDDELSAAVALMDDAVNMLKYRLDAIDD